MHIGNHHMCICNHRVGINCQLGLRGSAAEFTNTQKIDWTHIEDVKDPNKVILPSGDLVLIDLRMEHSGEHIPFFLLNDLPLDLGHGSGIETRVSESLGARVAGMTHVVSCPIALETEWPSSSNRLPFNPRSRA